MSKIQDLRTWMVLNESLMIIKTKESIVVIFSKIKDQNVKAGNGMQWGAGFGI